MIMGHHLLRRYWLLPSSPNDHGSSPTTPLLAPLGSPFNEFGSLGGSSDQAQLIQTPQSDTQKLASMFKRMEAFLKDSGFDSVGEFLKILFYNHSRLSGDPPSRLLSHKGCFSFSRNKIKMSDIIPLVYRHKHSAPSPNSPHYSERHAAFSPSIPPEDIFHARPALFSWATNLIATHTHEEINKLSCTNVSDSENHLQASMNGHRQDHAKLVTWEALGKLSISALCEKYKTCAPVSWHLMESMAAHRKNGKFVTKKRRPHLIVRVIC